MRQPEQGSATDGGTTGVRRENHYVLVIHGTGAAPEPGPIKWFQLPPEGPAAPGEENNFCRQLDRELQKLGWEPAVWRTPEAFARAGKVLEFSWSGGNKHEQRAAGAKKLAGLLRELREADPDARIHLLAHSHGGNVALAAVEEHLQWMRHLASDKSGDSIVEWQRALDPEFHRLGRLVLLGTPFYYKRWLAGAGAVARLLDRGRHWLFNALFCFGFWYVVVLALLGLASLLPWFRFYGWAPWGWPAAWWIVVLVLGLFTFLGAITDKEARRDVNLYFSGQWGFVDALIKAEQAPPLEALTVSAGLLDEALLALSTQPLASAFLVPPLREALEPRWWRWLAPLPAGIKKEPPVALERFVKGLVLVALNVVLLPVTVVRWLVSRPLAGWVAGKTRTALSAAALGVPAWEMENARIEVRGALDPVPGVLAPAWWDIERQLSEARSPDRLVAGGATYPFLWDDDELDRRLAGSKIWERVQPELEGILRRLGLTDAAGREARVRRLQRICVSLEERGREVVGSIELLHSAYYARPEFVRAIARFLARGEVPPGAVAADPPEG